MHFRKGQGQWNCLHLSLSQLFSNGSFLLLFGIMFPNVTAKEDFEIPNENTILCYLKITRESKMQSVGPVALNSTCQVDPALPASVHREQQSGPGPQGFGHANTTIRRKMAQTTGLILLSYRQNFHMEIFLKSQLWHKQQLQILEILITSSQKRLPT